MDELVKGLEGGKPRLFDLGRAHALYAELLGPVESLIRNKRHVLFVPTGPITGLPIHLLVTEKPAIAVPEFKDIGSYRDAAWLLKRQALTVLPSVGSLKALRVFARKDRGSKPMIGFGDPVFDPNEVSAAPPRGAERAARPVSTKTASRRAPIPTSGEARASTAETPQALPRLADTADGSMP